ncbi:hypothetical protein RclHR1_03950006 [Rhizophagus clarus]|uniref:F-box domain-containing protein n=1 Tax=Rhizophagus clarus TaxID=94130 RepID=A0A2Z6RUK9_9GLOM|nr:hypothetical protein RclHR1_03950006 [Rhizophagus clarus]GES92859.1 hypothetical protein GLOIN_2v1777651 [Rhizophagus clarus]
MAKLVRDILYLIFEELHDDKNTLYSCLLVNKTWSEIIIPILWRNPWKNLSKENELSLSNVIISHLSNETKNLLLYSLNYFSTKSYKKPLYNYINYCKHLNLDKIQRITNIIYKKSNQTITQDKIFSLFINKNTKFTHIYMPSNFNRRIHLIPGAEYCFSEIEFLSCNANIGDNILEGLMKICNSIKELEIAISGYKDSFEVVRLIETQKKLYNVHLLKEDLSYTIERLILLTQGTSLFFNNSFKKENSVFKCIENSLIKHAETIQYFRINRLPFDKLSSFINLKVLEVESSCANLDNLFLPSLQILRINKFVQAGSLISIIENTNGNLIEIIDETVVRNEIENKRTIYAIYQNCPKLRNLKLSVRSRNILELENLLSNCVYLSELYIYNSTDIVFNWDNLFRILAKSSPTHLFRFKFYNRFVTPELESLKLFFDNWKGRHSMILQFDQMLMMEKCSDMIEEYKAKGIISELIFQQNRNMKKIF